MPYGLILFRTVVLDEVQAKTSTADTHAADASQPSLQALDNQPARKPSMA